MADIEYLKSLQAVRDRAHLVLEAAERNELTHFIYHADCMPATAKFVASIINVFFLDGMNQTTADEPPIERFRPRSVRPHSTSWPMAAF